MESYKIRIPNADISRQVQEKAFRLGYKWASGDTIIRYTDNPRLVISSYYGIYAPNQGTFDILAADDMVISYQDFLALPEQNEQPNQGKKV